MGMLASLPHVIPSPVSFQNRHIKHHSHQEVYELDADLPTHGKLECHTSWTKLLFNFIFSREKSLFSRMVRSERGGGPSERRVPPRPRDSGELGPE